MRMPTTNRVQILTLAVVLGLGCGEGPQDSLCNPGPEFDIDLYVENLRAELADVAGYQIVVNQGGNLYHAEADGFSIYAGDPGGPVAMSNDTRLNVASVSKFIGATALAKVLDEHNISIVEPVHNYLPDRWKPQVHPDHFDAGSPFLVRFEDLLRMDTAIPFPGTSWTPGIMPTTDQMLTGLTQAADPARMGVYQNGNFTLIRVLIGQIEFGLDEGATDYNEATTDAYFSYIEQNIFDPLQITPPMSADAIDNYYAGSFARGHQYPFDASFQDGNGNVGWGATSDPDLNGGSGGLVLSSMDLAAVLAYFKHDQAGTLVSAELRDMILDNELGLIESMTGDRGRYQSKGGTRGPENTTSRALRSRVVFYPNGVEAVVLTNSNHGSMGSALRDSFDDAWVSGC